MPVSVVLQSLSLSTTGRVTYPISIMMNEIKFSTRKIKTEYSQPATVSLLTWNGRHTPAIYIQKTANEGSGIQL